MKKGIKTIIVRDDSGSMAQRRVEVINEIGRMLEDMRKEESDLNIEQIVQFVTFDSRVEPSKALSVKDVVITDYNKHMGGNTALLDAVSLALDLPEPWENDVVVIVMTDGEENCSRKTTKEALQAKVKEKMVKGWSITFLGPDISAWDEAKAMGVSSGNFRSFDAIDPQGMNNAIKDMNIMRYAYTNAKARNVDFNVYDVEGEAIKMSANFGKNSNKKVTTFK